MTMMKKHVMKQQTDGQRGEGGEEEGDVESEEEIKRNRWRRGVTVLPAPPCH